jgi:hypothetical protein
MILERRRFYQNQRELEGFLKRDSAMKRVLATFEQTFHGKGVMPSPAKKQKRRKRKVAASK